MSSFLWNAIEWNYNKLPPSNPYKKYLVIYAPWDFNYKANKNPRLALADYYPGEAPRFTYSDKPWHFSCTYSAKEKEILCWTDVGDVDDIVKKLIEERSGA